MSEICIGSVVKSHLEKMRLSLKVMSQYAEIPYSTLYSWSENRPPKDMVKAKKLADFLNISVDELLFGKKIGNSKAMSKNAEYAVSLEELISNLDQFEVVIRKK